MTYIRYKDYDRLPCITLRVDNKFKVLCTLRYCTTRSVLYLKMSGGEERLSASNILAGVLLKDFFSKIHQKRQQEDSKID